MHFCHLSGAAELVDNMNQALNLNSVYRVHMKQDIHVKCFKFPEVGRIWNELEGDNTIR